MSEIRLHLRFRITAHSQFLYLSSNTGKLLNCNGNGQCGTCKVEVKSGQVTPRTVSKTHQTPSSHVFLSLFSFLCCVPTTPCKKILCRCQQWLCLPLYGNPRTRTKPCYANPSHFSSCPALSCPAASVTHPVSYISPFWASASPMIIQPLMTYLPDYCTSCRALCLIMIDCVCCSISLRRTSSWPRTPPPSALPARPSSTAPL